MPDTDPTPNDQQSVVDVEAHWRKNHREEFHREKNDWLWPEDQPCLLTALDELVALRLEAGRLRRIEAACWYSSGHCKECEYDPIGEHLPTCELGAALAPAASSGGGSEEGE